MLLLIVGTQLRKDHKERVTVNQHGYEPGKNYTEDEEVINSLIHRFKEQYPGDPVSSQLGSL